MYPHGRGGMTGGTSSPWSGEARYFQVLAQKLRLRPRADPAHPAVPPMACAAVHAPSQSAERYRDIVQQQSTRQMSGETLRCCFGGDGRNSRLAATHPRARKVRTSASDPIPTFNEPLVQRSASDCSCRSATNEQPATKHSLDVRDDWASYRPVDAQCEIRRCSRHDGLRGLATLGAHALEELEQCRTFCGAQTSEYFVLNVSHHEGDPACGRAPRCGQ